MTSVAEVIRTECLSVAIAVNAALLEMVFSMWLFKNVVRMVRSSILGNAEYWNQEE